MEKQIMATMPEQPVIGDVWEQPISEIINNWYSCDGAKPGDWERLLSEKRQDRQYPDVVESIRKNGFVRPLTHYYEEQWDYNDKQEYTMLGTHSKFGDGHHRLAAAIDLGYAAIPVMHRESSAIADDSGSWRGNMPVRTDEQIAEDRHRRHHHWYGQCPYHDNRGDGCEYHIYNDTDLPEELDY